MSLASVAAGGGVEYAAARLNEGETRLAVYRSLQLRYPSEATVTLQAVLRRAEEVIQVGARLSPLSGTEVLPLGAIPRLLPAGEGIRYTIAVEVRNTSTGTIVTRTFQLVSPTSLSYPQLLAIVQGLSNIQYALPRSGGSAEQVGVMPEVLFLDVYSVLRG